MALITKLANKKTSRRNGRIFVFAISEIAAAAVSVTAAAMSAVNGFRFVTTFSARLHLDCFLVFCDLEVLFVVNNIYFKFKQGRIHE